MDERDQADKEIEVIESILSYIDRIRRNREQIEQYYFANKISEMQQKIHDLFEGILWIEFAAEEMHIPNHKEQKDQLFNGIGEAIEANDWLTVIDFISFGLIRYLRLIEQSLTDKHLSIIGGK